MNKTDIVVIQDGSNPTTPPELIKECLKAAQKNGACSAFLKTNCTVFKVNND